MAVSSIEEDQFKATIFEALELIDQVVKLQNSIKEEEKREQELEAKVMIRDEQFEQAYDGISIAQSDGMNEYLEEHLILRNQEKLANIKNQARRFIDAVDSIDLFKKPDHIDIHENFQHHASRVNLLHRQESQQALLPKTWVFFFALILLVNNRYSDIYGVGFIGSSSAWFSTSWVAALEF